MSPSAGEVSLARTITCCRLGVRRAVATQKAPPNQTVAKRNSPTANPDTTSFPEPASTQSPNPDHPRNPAGTQHPHATATSQHRQAAARERADGNPPKLTVCGPNTFPTESKRNEALQGSVFSLVSPNSPVTLPGMESTCHGTSQSHSHCRIPDLPNPFQTKV